MIKNVLGKKYLLIFPTCIFMLFGATTNCYSYDLATISTRFHYLKPTGHNFNLVDSGYGIGLAYADKFGDSLFILTGDFYNNEAVLETSWGTTELTEDVTRIKVKLQKQLEKIPIFFIGLYYKHQDYPIHYNNYSLPGSSDVLDTFASDTMGISLTAATPFTVATFENSTLTLTPGLAVEIGYGKISGVPEEYISQNSDLDDSSDTTELNLGLFLGIKQEYDLVSSAIGWDLSYQFTMDMPSYDALSTLPTHDVTFQVFYRF